MAQENLVDDELIFIAQDSLLAKYVRTIHNAPDEWFHYATQRLPEALRIHASRSDADWTVKTIESLGGVRISWLPNIMAYSMPFQRGKPPNEEVKETLRLLHETGRITRQEIASMVPTECIDYHEDMVVLDMCASPGSKTTQLAEHLFPSGVVIANEPSSGRLNTLSSNRSRVSLYNILITKHDGRHFPNIPKPGFDAILVDAPCTGSATTRKNPDVWASWSPTDGKSMFKLQLDILSRAASLLRDGGQLIYSTCSIDPIENEAVVAEFMRMNKEFHIAEDLPTLFSSEVFSSGMSTWPLVDQSCEEVTSTGHWLNSRGSRVEMLPPLEEHFELAKRNHDIEREFQIQNSLQSCLRLWPQSQNTGGFFVAKLVKKQKNPIEHTEASRQIQPRDADEFSHLASLPKHFEYPVDKNREAFWTRGKKILSTPKIVETRLFSPSSRNSKNAEYPVNTFAPLRLIHMGSPIFVEKKEVWRLRHESVLQFPYKYTETAYDIPNELAQLLLKEGQVELDSLPSMFEECPKGPLLLKVDTPRHTVFISAWIGAKLTPMVGPAEQTVLLFQLENVQLEESA
ncbi:MAG: RsmB/NOP family class I SAM-dependent RNA methyltransferase [archaeon]|nr:RsmB/NOP family class I SAM-dependent RNA methyltransferase [archaeon]MDA1167317.1 RsmB/NOP family class I SAM-dependent RNA methyltransferase [archaeon]